jgi:hypothetical protein
VTGLGGVVARRRGSHALEMMAASPGWRAVQMAAAPPGGMLMGACALEQLESAQVPRMWLRRQVALVVPRYDIRVE